MKAFSRRRRAQDVVAIDAIARPRNLPPTKIKKETIVRELRDRGMELSPINSTTIDLPKPERMASPNSIVRGRFFLQGCQGVACKRID
jgi:hypothetical protein